MDNKNQNKIRIATVLFAISQVMRAGSDPVETASSASGSARFLYTLSQPTHVVSVADATNAPVMRRVDSVLAKSSATIEASKLIQNAQAIARTLTKSAGVTFTSRKNIAGYLSVYKQKLSGDSKFYEIAEIHDKIVRLERISIENGTLDIDFEQNLNPELSKGPRRTRFGSASAAASTRAPSRATARAASEGGNSADTASEGGENVDSPRNRASDNVVVRPTLKRRNSAPAALGTGATVVAEVETPTVTTRAKVYPNPSSRKALSSQIAIALPNGSVSNPARPDFTRIAQRVVDLSKGVVVAPAANSQSDETASVGGSSNGEPALVGVPYDRVTRDGRVRNVTLGNGEAGVSVASQSPSYNEKGEVIGVNKLGITATPVVLQSSEVNKPTVKTSDERIAAWNAQIRASEKARTAEVRTDATNTAHLVSPSLVIATLQTMTEHAKAAKAKEAETNEFLNRNKGKAGSARGSSAGSNVPSLATSEAGELPSTRDL